jgi:hypothetical protein
MQEGFFFFTPKQRSNIHLNYWMAFEPMENLFLEASFSARKSGVAPVNYYGTVGLRLNMQRREYDY